MNEGPKDIEARPPNWLPLPFAEKAKPRQLVDEDDLFAKGEIADFFPNQGVGRIKNSKGEFIPFRLSDVRLAGRNKAVGCVCPGLKVGYDIARGTMGKVVTCIKVY